MIIATTKCIENWAIDSKNVKYFTFNKLNNQLTCVIDDLDEIMCSLRDEAAYEDFLKKWSEHYYDESYLYRLICE